MEAAQINRVTAYTRPDGAVVVRSTEVDRYDRRCMQDWLFHWAKARPQSNFLFERTAEPVKWIGVTYGEASDHIRKLACALAGMELGAQRPILIISGNGIDHQLLSLAAMTAGIPFAAVSPAYSLLDETGAKLQKVIDALEPGLIYAADGKAFAHALAMPLMRGRHLLVSTNVEAAPQCTMSVDALLRHGAEFGSFESLPRPGPDALVKWIFTSGSTGHPKAVITTQRMICSDVDAIARRLGVDGHPITAIDWLPWSHVYGGSFGIGLTLRTGGSLYIDDGRPTDAEFRRTVENLQGLTPTIFWNVPKYYQYLVERLSADENFAASFFSNLSVMIYGAASLPQEVSDKLKDLIKRFALRDVKVVPAWGMTETTTIACIGNGSETLTSEIGLPIAGIDLKLVPTGDKYEARVRGGIVTPGYWNDERATADSLDEEGYFRTGDAMRLIDIERPELGLSFEGRIKEDFKLLSGTWVNVTEVRERYLAALEGYASDVVVVGPDRDDLALLIFPTESFDPDRMEGLRKAFLKASEGKSGTSRVIMRAAIVEDPPSAEAGEVTEKGSLNARRIRDNRKDLINRIYLGTASGMLLPLGHSYDGRDKL